MEKKKKIDATAEQLEKAEKMYGASFVIAFMDCIDLWYSKGIIYTIFSNYAKTWSIGS